MLRYLHIQKPTAGRLLNTAPPVFLESKCLAAFTVSSYSLLENIPRGENLRSGISSSVQPREKLEKRHLKGLR